MVDRNVRFRRHEIDLVIRRGRVVAFVEVKARAGGLAAVDAVGQATRFRIRAAGGRWIAGQAARGADLSRFSFRYDIVAVLPRRWPRHFTDAF